MPLKLYKGMKDISKEGKQIAVSACLAGFCTKYNGGHNKDRRIKQLVDEGKAIVVCPESASGLPIPRLPSEIVGGDGEDVLDGKAKVFSKDGKDLTAEFIRGAEKTLERVRQAGVSVVILKERSPSCGVNMIYDGTFQGGRKPGSGVAAALLKRHGYTLYTEEDSDEFLKQAR